MRRDLSSFLRGPSEATRRTTTKALRLELGLALGLAGALLVSAGCATSRDAGEEVGAGAGRPPGPSEPTAGMPGQPQNTLTLAPGDPIVKVDGKSPFKLDFKHCFGSGSIMWLTFSSRRTYGVHNNITAQIWMLPVDVRKLDKGEDSGFPPFWLPFQDLATGNHIPQWVEQVERAPCSVTDMTGCGPTEVCSDGVCVPRVG